jgi:hypothetical protein
MWNLNLMEQKYGYHVSMPRRVPCQHLCQFTHQHRLDNGAMVEYSMTNRKSEQSYKFKTKIHLDR